MLIDTMSTRDMYQVYEINDDWLIYQLYVEYTGRYVCILFKYAAYLAISTVLLLQVTTGIISNCVLMRYKRERI